MKILRDRDDPKSKVKDCQYCSTIVEIEDSDVGSESTPWSIDRRGVYKYYTCPKCNKRNYISHVTEFRSEGL